MAKKEKAFSIESVGKVDGTEIFTILEEAERLQKKMHEDVKNGIKKYVGEKITLPPPTYQDMTNICLLRMIAELRYEIARLKADITYLKNNPSQNPFPGLKRLENPK